MAKKEAKIVIRSILIVVAVFWISDFFMHFSGVGESNYYYISKLANSILFATLFFLAFDWKEHWKKLAFSFVFGTWISFYYLVSSYSGFVQWLGLYARYTPPPFEIFGVMLTPYIWWFFHALVFYVGLEISELFRKR